MSDTDTTELTQSVEDAPDGTDGDSGKDSGGGLRKQLEAALKENRDLKSGKRDELLESIGLESDKGLGKALAEKFDAGDIGIDNLVDTAVNEYGHVVPEGQHPQAQNIAQGQAELDQLQTTGGSVAPLSNQDKIAQAEAAGDNQASLALKGAQLGEMFGR